MSAIGLIGGLNMDHDIWFYQNLIHTIEEISENSPAIYLFGGENGIFSSARHRTTMQVSKIIIRRL